MTASASPVLLLTGRPGVGKTTIVGTVAGALSGRRVGGFYTEEIRMAGGRQGFHLVTFDGQAVVMAHIQLALPTRVGKYGVDVRAIDRVASAAINPGARADVYLVDEIGRMEVLSDRFVAAMRGLLASGKPIVATVAQRGGGFIAEIKRWPGADLWEVTRANRAALPERVLAWLHRWW